MKSRIMLLIFIIFLSCITPPTIPKGDGEKIEFGIVFSGTTNGIWKTMMLFSNRDTVPVTYWSDTAYDDELVICFTERKELWDTLKTDFNFTITTVSDTENINTKNRNVYFIKQELEGDFMHYYFTVPAGVTDTIIPRNGFLNLNYKSDFIKITYTFQYSGNTCDKVIYIGKGRPDYQTVQMDKEVLEITYSPGDNVHYVTKDIVLPTSGPSGSSINWVSNYSTIISPTGSVNRPSDGKGIGDVDVTLTATLSKGTDIATKIFCLTVIGNNPITGTLTDIDGNVYQTVIIANQEWTVENLRTTKFNDGSSIPLITDSTAWNNRNTPAYCYFKNTANGDSIKKFGALYNWHVVATGKLAPIGWHVPSDSEWTNLEYYLHNNGYGWAGTSRGVVAKAVAQRTGWKFSTITSYPGNVTGFSAFPGNERTALGSFPNGVSGFWWSSTETSNPVFAYNRSVMEASSIGLMSESKNKSCGISIRLVKDPTYTLTVNAANGAVTKSPDKPVYAYHDTVLLTAKPDSGYRFLNWNGDTNGTNPVLSMIIDKNKNLTAVFSRGVIGYVLTVNTTNGSVIKIPEKPNYDSGEVVTISAEIPVGYCFIKWSGDANGTDTITTLTMDGNKSVTAHFAALCTLKTIGRNGIITKNPDKLVYASGDTVILSVIANSGYTFSNVTPR